MKRDMDLVRGILSSTVSNDKTVLTKYTPEQIGYHVAIMIDAGLIDGKASAPSGSIYPTHYYIRRLTWAGHEFLEVSSDSTSWQKAKDSFIDKGVSWSFDLLIEFLKREASQRFLGGPSDS